MPVTLVPPRQVADPVATLRRRRDRVRKAAAESTAAFNYAGGSARQAMADARAFAEANPAAMPADIVDWVNRVNDAIDDPNFGWGVYVPETPSVASAAAQNKLDTIASWAAKRQTAAVIRPILREKLRLAQHALEAGLAQNPTAPGDTPPTPEPLPQDDADAETVLNHAHTEWLIFGSGNEFRCGEPTVGHGHVGRPCENVLGPDGICQDHP